VLYPRVDQLFFQIANLSGIRVQAASLKPLQLGLQLPRLSVCLSIYIYILCIFLLIHQLSAVLGQDLIVVSGAQKNLHPFKICL